MRELIRSGWWVAVAAVVVTVAVAAALVAQHGLLGRGRAAAPPFDLASLTVPAAWVTVGSMARDGVATLDHAATVTAEEVDRRNHEGRGKVLVPSDRVVGLALGGEARAYPIRLLWWHEVVNDTLGGEPVAITYSPLCDSVVVFSRRVGGEVLSFGASGLVMGSNHLLYDHRPDLATASLWSQLQARAVSGPAGRAATTLSVLPCDLTTWAEWRAAHPTTDVLASLPALGRLYKRAPYSSYFGSDLLRFPSPHPPPPSDLALKDRVVAITLHGERRVLALPHLARAAGSDAGEVTITLAGTDFTVRFSRELATSTVSAAGGLPAGLDLRRACWFAWHDAFPGEMPAP